MTERYVKVSELERIAASLDAEADCQKDGDIALALQHGAGKLRSLIAAAQPREVDEDELAQFIRTTDGNNTMGAGALAESIVGFLAKRHERGEEGK